MNKKSISRNFISLVIVILLVVGLIIGGFHIVESTFLNNNQEPNGEEVESKTITRDGIDYFPRQDITTFLFMGIDKFGPMEASGSYNNDGEADVISLIIFDESEQSFRILSLNRDTIVNMPVLGIGGYQAGTINGQLALAHTYGSGLKDSSENTRDTISKMINNIPINYYFSVNMDVISILTDAVGGVEVNVTDDFSSVDNTIKSGKQLLNGEQAISFVRTRKDVGDQLNISRMERQEEFLNGFMNAFQNKIETDENILQDIYDKSSQYIVSDCSLTTLMSLTDKYNTYTLKDIVTPKGENKKGDKYMEFYLDEESFDDLVIDLFYAEK